MRMRYRIETLPESVCESTSRNEAMWKGSRKPRLPIEKQSTGGHSPCPNSEAACRTVPSPPRDRTRCVYGNSSCGVVPSSARQPSSIDRTHQQRPRQSRDGRVPCVPRPESAHWGMCPGNKRGFGRLPFSLPRCTPCVRAARSSAVQTMSTAGARPGSSCSARRGGVCCCQRLLRWVRAVGTMGITVAARTAVMLNQRSCPWVQNHWGERGPVTQQRC